MTTNRLELTQKLKKWIDDEDVLANARKFLRAGSRSGGLTDAQLANWWRRDGLPNSFVEGAALYHCAQTLAVGSNVANEHATKIVGMYGKCFWQVFVVSDRPTGGKYDCSVFRYWANVVPLEGARSAYLSHKTWLTGGIEEAPVVDLLTREPLARSQEADGWDVIEQTDTELQVIIYWKVGKKRRDYGYAFNVLGGVETDRLEYLGGNSAIPVESSRLVAFLPRRLLSPSILNPHGIPSCLQASVIGAPITGGDFYLNSASIEKLQRYDPWLKAGPPVRHHQTLDRLDIPPRLGEKLPQPSEDADIFDVEINQPLPHLRYLLVFGKPG